MRSNNPSNFIWDEYMFDDWQLSEADTLSDEKKIPKEIARSTQFASLFPALVISSELDCELYINNAPIHAKKLTIKFNNYHLTTIDEAKNAIQNVIDAIQIFTDNRIHIKFKSGYSQDIVRTVTSTQNSQADIVLMEEDFDNFLVVYSLKTKIENKIRFYEESKQHAENSSHFPNLKAYQELCDHNLVVLEAAKDFLDDKKTISQLCLIENAYSRWVEGKEPRELVEEVKKLKLKKISPKNLALTTRISQKINDYRKNIQAEEDAFFGENKSRTQLWKHKINVLEKAQEQLFNNDPFYFYAFNVTSYSNFRWIDGKETRALVEEMKRLKGIPEHIIALDTKIDERINDYEMNIANANTSIFSFNKDTNIKLWQDKIDILQSAKRILYGEANINELNTFDANWERGKKAKELVDAVIKLHDEGRTIIKEDKNEEKQMINPLVL